MNYKICWCVFAGGYDTIMVHVSMYLNKNSWNIHVYSPNTNQDDTPRSAMFRTLSNCFPLDLTDFARIVPLRCLQISTFLFFRIKYQDKILQNFLFQNILGQYISFFLNLLGPNVLSPPQHHSWLTSHTWLTDVNKNTSAYESLSGKWSHR